ncbi:MAG: hypothetical protein IT420_06075 [Candidatus Brocadia sp.]|nr:hypothetical protein [Candidatus Brocadia fulgida]MCC6325193.1 hypothetical protein [Candidatus Brocadia sp.]
MYRNEPLEKYIEGAARGTEAPGGVACYLADAASRCVKLNVEINPAALKNQELMRKA